MQWFTHLIDKDNVHTVGVQAQMLIILEWLGYDQTVGLICQWGNWPEAEIDSECSVWIESTGHWLTNTELLAFIRWLHTIHKAEGIQS